jgi:pimeloyl-ACP methyl ester carboxylesterase
MTTLSFYETGKGYPVLLIHGFPMNAAIWRKMSDALSPSLRIISIDLPGFGNSPLLKIPFSVDDVADVVLENLDQKGIKNIIPIGHSLGGYVVLAMVKKRPELFQGFGLLHSTALADSPEKKESRAKVIEFIEKNGAEAFTSNFITPLFSDPNHQDVPFVREMNMKTERETLIAYTAAMRERPDRTDVLRDFQKPILFVAGAKDPGIPVKSIESQASDTYQPIVEILPQQSHMSLIEDVQTTSRIVYDFVMKCTS